MDPFRIEENKSASIQTWLKKRKIVTGTAFAGAALFGAEYAALGATEQDLTEWRGKSQSVCQHNDTKGWNVADATAVLSVPSHARVEAIERLSERYPDMRFYTGSTPLMRILSILLGTKPTEQYHPLLNSIFITDATETPNGQPLLTERTMAGVYGGLAHAEQARREGRARFFLRSVSDIALNAFQGRPYDRLYTNGSFEQEAHRGENNIEEQIRRELRSLENTGV